MNYLVAVLSDRFQAEAAYTALERAELPLENIAILGKGYRSADEYGLVDPAQPARQQINLLAIWTIPFGFAAGVAFNSLTGIEIVGSPIGDRLLGGLLGALAGAMGSFFVGGGVGASVGAGDALSYRNRLNAGQYLIIVEGDRTLFQSATAILRQFEPETLQGYADAQDNNQPTA